ncbi:hypothetical protein JW710_04425 [Candidatus Dojkabacteria bacterium]|nr:hypothetical protein [Candidatus Dojkabacteria bacterium]
MAVVSYKDTLQRLLRSPRRKTYTMLGATLVIILVFLLGAIRPTISTISKLRGEIKTRRSVNSALQTKINNLQTLQDIYYEKQDDLEFIDDYYPANSDYSLLMANLERIANSYDFEVILIHVTSAGESNVGESVDYTGMERMEMRMVVEGDRNDLSALVRHIENLPVVPELARIAMSPTGAEGTTFVRCTIDMFMYKQSSKDVSAEES